MLSIRLCSGIGSYESRSGCWMAALNYLATGSLQWSDHPDCVCRVIQHVCIWINDNLHNYERNEIIGPRLFDPIGTNTGHEHERLKLLASRLLIEKPDRFGHPNLTHFLESRPYDARQATVELLICTRPDPKKLLSLLDELIAIGKQDVKLNTPDTVFEECFT